MELNRRTVDLFGSIFIVLIIFIYGLIKMNIYALIIAGILFMIAIVILIRKLIKGSSMRIQYKKSEYYADTKIPFRLSHAKEEWFKIECYNHLRRELGSKVKIMTDLRIPKFNRTKIDILLFHETGIYVIDIKDYDGYVQGSRNDARWGVGTYDGYSFEFNQKTNFYNPIIRNETHPSNLNKIIPFDYKSYVIFSDTMIFSSDIENIVTIERFIEMIKSSPVAYKDIWEMDRIYSELKQYNHEDNRQLGMWK